MSIKPGNVEANVSHVVGTESSGAVPINLDWEPTSYILPACVFVYKCFVYGSYMC